ncbi:MAG TPA: branched-chain amino acid ABC transporter substrate-binding protein [Acidimicrobiia bacterium]|jgi:branched-chain amino acid transport system substrate-binding protein|nr:branched-chain amino acid ABC transporter substrate-binding protein [Acidimicrobiia bacterium]
MKASRFLVAFAALALLAAACGGGGSAAPDVCDSDSADADPFGCVTVAAGDPIKLGTLLVITGENQSLGLDSQYGAQLAVDYFGDNAFDGVNGTLLGHEITLVNEDEGCSAEGGTAGANRLVTDTQIIAVIGTSCSSAALGVADKIFSDRGIPLVSPSNTGPALTVEGTHQPFYFRTAHNDKLQGAVVADFAYNELPVASAATIHDGSPYAEGLANAFAESFQALGGTITDQVSIQTGESDYSSILTDLATGSPELLYFPIFVAEGGLITQQARENGSFQYLAGSDGMFTPDWIAAAGAENAEGVYISGPDLTKLGGDAAFYTDQFKPAYIEAYGLPTSVFHAHTYDAVNMVLAAIESVAIEDGDTLYIPRTALKDALYATENFPGLTGNLTCNELGDCQQSATIGVVSVANGAFTDYVFSKTVGLEG